MRYKRIGETMSFADIALSKSMENNRAIKMLERINKAIKWRNKKISKKRYIVEQYFGLSHMYDGSYRERFTTILKNIWDTMCRRTCPVQCVAYFTGVAFNLFRRSKLLATG